MDLYVFFFVWFFLKEILFVCLLLYDENSYKRLENHTQGMRNACVFLLIVERHSDVGAELNVQDLHLVCHKTCNILEHVVQILSFFAAREG